MRKEIKDLILDDEEFIVHGDLLVTGKVNVKDSNVVVSGELSITDDDSEELITIEGSDITAGSISIKRHMKFTDGDIWTPGNLLAQNIDADGDIEVGKSADVRIIFCQDYVVNEKNTAAQIIARDIYIGGESNSCELMASRDIYFGSKANLNGCEIEVKGDFFHAGQLLNCERVSPDGISNS